MSMLPHHPVLGSILLGKYRVDSVIGAGGMGAVVKAHHLDLDEPVAIKTLLPELLERADIVTRFLREARAAVKLKGPHVARVLDVGRLENGIPYIVMEHLDGADLNAIVKHYGAQPPPLAVDLILQACDALAEAHSLGIIHRDIKASNFFVTHPEGQQPSLKVLDFGIATAPEGTSDLTSTTSVMGTPSYMAPEQMRSTKTSDQRSDIWSIGVVLYEILEGARPWRGEAYSELCLSVAMDPPVPMLRIIPPGLHQVVMKCLAKPVDLRYQNVGELARDLLPFSSDPQRFREIVERCAGFSLRRPSIAMTARPSVSSGFGQSPPGVNQSPTPSSFTPMPRFVSTKATTESSEPGFDEARTSFSESSPDLVIEIARHEQATAMLPPGADAARVPVTGSTPPPLAPLVPMVVGPLTSLSAAPLPAPPAHSAGTVLGYPTPVPTAAVKTPTSLHASNGQLVPVPALPAPGSKRGRRGPAMIAGVVIALGIAGGGVFVASGKHAAQVQPAARLTTPSVVTPPVVRAADPAASVEPTTATLSDEPTAPPPVATPPVATPPVVEPATVDVNVPTDPDKAVETSAKPDKPRPKSDQTKPAATKPHETKHETTKHEATKPTGKSGSGSATPPTGDDLFGHR